MKSKILMTILVVAALLLSVSMASAAVSVTSTYSASSPTFGSSSTMASNPNADSTADEDIYDTAIVTIANSGATNLTVSSITVSANSGFTNSDDNDDGYINITLVSSTTISANGTGTATLSGRIPANLDAVDSSLEESAFKVATVTFVMSDASTAIFDAYGQRKNMIEIKDLDITVDGDKDSYDDGDDVKDVKPENEIVVELQAENNFDEDDDDVQIEDIGFLVKIDDGDMDVDEDDDMGDLDPEEEGDGSVSFTVDEDVDDDSYNMEVSVEGDDEHGARHGELWELDFKVEKKTHDIIIKSASISDSEVSCQRGSNSIQVKLINIGKKDEDEVSLYVKNSDIGLDFEKTDMEIDEGDDYSKTVSFNVPEDLKSGTYPIRVSAYYSGDDNDGVLGDLEDVDLVVSACAITAPAPTVPTTKDITTTPSGDIEVTIPEDVLEKFGITETEENKPLTDSVGFVIALTVIVTIASLGLIGGIIYMVLLKP